MTEAPADRGRFSDREYVPTTAVFWVDDDVDATDDFGGGRTEHHSGGID